MKRLVFFLLAIFSLIQLNAQSTEQADRAFRQGKYSDARRLYETTGSISKGERRNEIYALAQKSRECASLVESGQSEIKKRNYSKALAAYKELLRLNPSDANAKKMISVTIPALIDKDKQDQADWATISVNPSLQRYRDYVNKHPNGRYIADARKAIKTIEARNRAEEERRAQERARAEELLRQEDEAYKTFVASNNINDGYSYLAKYPSGRYALETKTRLVELYCNNNEYNEARQLADNKKLKDYIDVQENQYKRRIYGAEAKRAYDVFSTNPSRPAGEEFIRQYSFSSEAKDVRRWLVEDYCKYDEFTNATIMAQGDKDMLSFISAKEEAAAFKSFKSYSTLDKGKAFVTKYPNSSNVNTVKDWMVKQLCKDKDFRTAQKYAYNSQQQAVIDRAVNRQYRRESFTTDMFAKHFAQFQVGGEGDVINLSYAYVPSRYGAYVTLGLADFGIFAGPVMRLWNDDKSVDLQVYGGLGFSSYGDRSFSWDAGIRIGWHTESKLSLYDLSIGTQNLGGTQVVYVGFGAGICLISFGIVGALALG